MEEKIVAMDDCTEGRKGVGEVLRNMGSEGKMVDPFRVTMSNSPAPLEIERLERIAEAIMRRLPERGEEHDGGRRIENGVVEIGEDKKDEEDSTKVFVIPPDESSASLTEKYDLKSGLDSGLSPNRAEDWTWHVQRREKLHIPNPNKIDFDALNGWKQEEEKNNNKRPQEEDKKRPRKRHDRSS